MEAIANLILILAGIYLFAGLCFYLAFIFKWAGQLDENTIGSSLGFKLLILPGIVFLWPFILGKWKQSRARTSKNNSND